MQRHGFPLLVGCSKWKGCVEDGITHLRSYKSIVIHPRCTHAAEEARLYSYKTDPLTGDILPIVLDKHNHIWDSTRYALEPIIKNSVQFLPIWWKSFDLAKVESLFTLRWLTISISEVTEESAQLGISIQHWGIIGFAGMCLIEEQRIWGTLPELIEGTKAYWKAFNLVLVTIAEVWIDHHSVGATFIRTLRQAGLPAREWNPDDKTITEPLYRAKQAAVFIAEGRIAVFKDAPVTTESEGLSTNALTLAIMVWQTRGGGRGPIPAPFERR